MITVTDLFRYPVKSMQGLAEPTLDLTAAGFEGDRRWALIDRETGRLMSAKRWSALLMASADDEAITLPDGSRVVLVADDADAALSAWLGREVHLAEAASGTEVSYEMTFDPPDDHAEYYAIHAPPGSFLDLTAAHLAARPTLREAGGRHGDLDWDIRRFRPNLVVDGDLEPFGEDAWVGATLRVGTARLGGPPGHRAVRHAAPGPARPRSPGPDVRRPGGPPRQPPGHLPRRRGPGPGRGR